MQNLIIINVLCFIFLSFVIYVLYYLEFILFIVDPTIFLFCYDPGQLEIVLYFSV